MPISNKPNLKQETSRIRTPMPGKMMPEIKFMVDHMSQSLWCFKSSLHHCQQFGYNIDPSSYDNISIALGQIGVRNWLNKDHVKVTRPKHGQPVQKFKGKLF